jgi:YD repeat-containing protein
MVAIVTGNSLGLANSSSAVLGQGGIAGNAVTGNNGESVFVNVSNGNLVLQDQDDYLVGIGFDLALTRTYNSQGLLDGGEGVGWTVGPTQHLSAEDGPLSNQSMTVTRTGDDGAASHFTLLNDGTYVSTDGDGAYDTLKYVSGSYWLFTDGATGVAERYSLASDTVGGRLISRADRDGNSVTYSYDTATGQIASIRYAGRYSSREVVQFAYTNGKLASVSMQEYTSEGVSITTSRVKYRYDGNGRLSMVVTDLTPDNLNDNPAAGQLNANVYWTRYDYDGASARINKISQSDGSEISLSYVQDGASWRVQSMTDGMQNTTTFVTSGSYTTVRNALNEDTVYHWNAEGQLLSVASPALVDGSVPTRTYSYDAQGNVKTMTTSEGRLYTYDYDERGNLMLETQPSPGDGAPGKQIKRSYNLANQLITESVYPSGSQLATAAAPNYAGSVLDNGSLRANTRYFVYDREGHLRFQVSAEGRVIEHRYFDNGEIASTIDYQASLYGAVDTDAIVALSESQLSAWVTTVGIAGASPAIGRTDYVYDLRGQLRTESTYAHISAGGEGIVDADASLTTYTYDPTGKLVHKIRQNSITPVDSTPPPDLRGQFALNVSGPAYNVVTQQFTTTITYTNTSGAPITGPFKAELHNLTVGATVDNATGMLNGMPFIAVNVGVVAPGDSFTVRYVLNIPAKGSLGFVPSLFYDTEVADPATVTSYEYDGLGRMTRQVDANGATSIAYDAAQHRIVTTMANGLVSTATYDAAGRLTSQSTNDGTTAAATTQYTYDEAGRVRMTQLPNGLRSYILYDADGRKTADIDGDGSLVEYRYNADGQIIKTIAYASTVDLSLLLDANGKPANVALADLVSSETYYVDQMSWNFYDGAGRLAKSVDAEGHATVYAYDPIGRPIGSTMFADRIYFSNDDDIRDSIPGTTPGEDRETHMFYGRDGEVTGTLDGRGFLTEYKYTIHGEVSEKIAYSQPSDYDASASYGGAVLPRPSTLDPVHDRREQYFYDRENRLVQTVDAENMLTTLSYDRNGNLIGRHRFSTPVSFGPSGKIDPAATAADQVTSYTYTQFDQVASEHDIDGTVTTHAYNAMGQLVSSTRGVGTPSARTTSVRYDLNGRVSAELSPVGAAALAALPTSPPPTVAQITAIWNQYAVTYTYDAAGLRTSMTDQAGLRTLYFYENDGSLAATVRPGGEVETRAYNGNNQLVTLTTMGLRLYDGTVAAMGPGGILSDGLRTLLASMVDQGLNSVVTYEYNTLGELTSQHDNSDLVLTQYNAFGELAGRTTTIDGRFGPAVDSGFHTEAAAGLNYTESYRYDQAGNRIALSVFQDDGSQIPQSWEYNAFGQAVKAIDADGRSVDTGYDRVGRAISLAVGANPAATTIYDAFGRVFRSIDPSGKTTQYDYNDATRTMTVTTPEGHSQSVTSNAFGQQVSVQDASGRATTYSYDQNGNLLSVADELGTRAIDTYDAKGRLLTSLDGNGVQTRYEYDASSRLFHTRVTVDGVEQTTTTTYDPLGHVLTVTDPRGIVTATQYDGHGRIEQVVVDAVAGGANLTTQFFYSGRGLTRVVDPDGRVTAYEYDAYDRRSAEIIDPDTEGVRTSYSYDNRGNLISKTDANYHVTRYVYDGQNQLVDQVDATGAVIHYSYDANQRLTRTIGYANLLDAGQMAALDGIDDGALMQLVVADAARDNNSALVYDGDGRLRYTMDAMGAVVKRDYDATGKLSGTIAFAGLIAPSTALTMAAMNAATDAVANGAQDNFTGTVYDVRGRLGLRITATGGSQAFQYDGNGNLIASQSYASFSSGFAVAQQRMVYDANNRMTGMANAKTIDPLTGEVTEWAVVQQRYDNSGNLIARVDSAATLAAPSEGVFLTQAGVAAWIAGVPVDPAHDAAVRFAFDGANRRVGTATAQHVDASGVLLWSVVRDTLDGDGNVLERRALGTFVSAAALEAAPSGAAITAWSSAAPQNGAVDRVTTMEYDRANRLAVMTDAAQLTTTFVYDGVGNLQTQIAGDYPDRRTVDYTYDAANRLVLTMGDTVDAGKQRGYDAFGHVIETHIYGAHRERYVYGDDGKLRFSIDALDYVTETRYDGTGAVVATLLFSAPAAVPYNAPSLSVGDLYQLVDLNDPLIERTLYTHDAAGNPSSVTDAMGYTETYLYDGLGRKTQFTNKLLHTWVYEYDAAGRMVQENAPDINVSGVATPVSMHTRISYDALGNVTARTEALGLAGSERTTRYEYDLAGRQTKTILPPVAVYDANGDTQAATTTGAVETMPAQGATTTVLYDALGNAVASTDALGNVSRKLYDAQGRVLLDIDALGFVTEHTYDRFGDEIKLVRTAESVFASKWQQEVIQLYALMTGRAPDPAGAANMLAGLKAGVSFVAAADQMFTNVEVQSLYPLGLSAAEFVAKLFVVAVNRQPTAAELAAFTGLMQAPGGTRGSVAEAVMLSLRDPADLAVWNSKLEASGSAGAVASRLVVTRLYAALLGRAASQLEMQNGLMALASESADAFANSLFQLPAFAAVYADGQFATKLYEHMFDRAPVPADHADDFDNYAGFAGYGTAVLHLIDTVTTQGGADAAYFLSNVARLSTPVSIADYRATQWTLASAIELVSNLDHANDRVLIQSFDRAGRLIRVTEALSAFNQVYGVDGSFEFSNGVGFSNKVTTYDYSFAGDLIKQSIGLVDQRGILVTTTSDTRYDYNARGDRVAVFVEANGQLALEMSNHALDTNYIGYGPIPGLDEDYGGYLTQMTYDAAGNLKSVIDYAGLIQHGRGYSVDGFFVDEIYPNLVAGAPARVTDYGYDLNNLRSSETKVQVEVDGVGTGAVAATRGKENVVTQYDYDRVGNLTATTNALAGKTISYYDALGRVSAIASRVDDTRYTFSTFERDIYGNVVKQTVYANGATVDADGNATMVGADPEHDRVTVSEFDLNGQVTHVTDANGHDSFASYDLMGRLAKRWQSVTLANVQDSTTRDEVAYSIMQYDALGRLVSTATPGTSNTVLATGGLTGGFVNNSVQYHDDFDGTDYYNGTDTLTLHYPDVGASEVRVTSVVLLTNNVVETRVDTGQAAGATIEWFNSRASAAVFKVQSVQVEVKDSQGVWHTLYSAAGDHLDGHAGIGTVTTPMAVRDEKEYNSFGELVSVLRDGKEIEYSRYDAMGRVWLTNAGDGVDKILLYNQLGQVSVQIRSAQNAADGIVVDLKSFASASDIDDTTPHLLRTQMYYDLMGRVIRTTAAGSVDKLPPAVLTTTSVVQTTVVEVDVNQQTTYVPPHAGVADGSWAGTNQLTLALVLPDGLGEGDVRVTVNYTSPASAGFFRVPNDPEDPSPDPDPVPVPGGEVATYTQDFSNAGLTLDGAGRAFLTLSWGAKPPLNTEAIDSITVWKKDASGTWQQLTTVAAAPVGKPFAMPQKTGGPYLRVPSPALTLSYRARFTYGAYTTLQGHDFGQGVLFDLSGIPEGEYSFGAGVSASGVMQVYRDESIPNSVFLSYVDTGQSDAAPKAPLAAVFQRFDRWGNLVEKTDPRNINWSTVYTYNDANQMTEMDVIEKSVVDGVWTSTTRAATSYFYDALGRQIGTRDANSNHDGLAAATITMSYDLAGNVIDEHHDDGGLVHSDYDLFGDRIVARSSVGGGSDPIIVNYGYDFLGRLTDTTSAMVAVYVLDTPTNSGGMGMPTTPVLRTLSVHYDYDAIGRRFKTTNSDGGITLTGYDVPGNVIGTRDAAGIVMINAYDDLGNKIRQVDGEGGSMSWTYSVHGVMETHTDLGGALITYAHNSLNQLTTQTSAARGHDQLSQNLIYTYDDAGLLTRTEDLTSHIVTSYAYDLAGNRRRERTVQLNATSVQTFDPGQSDERTEVTELYMALLNRAPEVGGLFFWMNDLKSGKSMIDVANSMLGSGETHHLFDPAASDDSFVTTLYQSVLGRAPDASERSAMLGALAAPGGTRGAAIVGLINGSPPPTGIDAFLQRVAVALGPLAGAGAATGGAVVQNNTITYDEFNRLSHVEDGRYTLDFGYDNTGNRTYVRTRYDDNGTPVDTEAYNTFDREGRQLIVNGTWTGTEVVIGQHGHQLTYDQAGNRRTDTYLADPGNPASVTTESYSYDAAGRLTTTMRTDDRSGLAILINERKYDDAGRLVQSGAGFNLSGGAQEVLKHMGVDTTMREIAYDKAGKVLRQKAYDGIHSDEEGKLDDTYYTAFSDRSDAENALIGYDKAGNLKGYYVVPHAAHTDTQLLYHISYAKLDGYQQQVSSVRRGGEFKATTFAYDQNGQLMQVQEDGGVARTFVNDKDGRILTATSGGAVTTSLIVNGELLGSSGGSGADLVPGNFATTYTSTTASGVAEAPRVYVVANGDTLQSIAKMVWGDSKLWYLIADANGLSGAGALASGTQLTLPVRVNTVSNDFKTFKLYDPSALIGETTPTLPPPAAADGGCGTIGQIIVIVVAVVVTIYSAGLLAGPAGTAALGVGATISAGATALGAGVSLGTAAAFAGAAAIGSIVSQGVGIALGVQDSFSWKSVALSAFSAVANPGITIAGAPVASAAANAAIGNALTQGVGIVIGAQDHFDWRGVAASAAGAAVAQSINGPRGASTTAAAAIARGALASFAGGLTASVLHGGKVSVQQIAVDAFGNALGQGIVGAMQPSDPLGDFIKKLESRLPQTNDFDTLPSLDKRMGQSGVYESSQTKADVLANSDISKELSSEVTGSKRYSVFGRFLAAIGLSDSPAQIGVSITMPTGDKPGYEKLRDMWDSDTGSLRKGYKWADLTAAAMDAKVQIVPVTNGITNSPSQAYSNSLSLSIENQVLNNDVILVSAYNPTANKQIDGVEAGMIKFGTDTASVEASRIMIERSVNYNTALAKDQQNPSLSYTQVWGHSEGAAIMTQALMSEDVDKDVLKMVDLKLLGNPSASAPAGLHTFISVGNKNDSVASFLGRTLSFTGGVENSAGYKQGNALNANSYQYVPTDFTVVTPPGQTDANHSWQYYMSDATTRKAFGFVPLSGNSNVSTNLREFYGHSYWKKGE